MIVPTMLTMLTTLHHQTISHQPTSFTIFPLKNIEVFLTPF